MFEKVKVNFLIVKSKYLNRVDIWCEKNYVIRKYVLIFSYICIKDWKMNYWMFIYFKVEFKLIF